MKYEKELEVLKRLYEAGAFKPDFYNKKIPSIQSFDNYEEFIKIPFTFKKELRDTSVEERSTTTPENIYGVFSSSGTTGQKTFYIYNKEDKKVHEKFVRSFYEELDVEASDIGGVMAPVDTGVMAHTMMWQFTTMGAGYVNCPVPSPENIVDTISKVPVTIVATRPSIATNIVYNPVIKKIAHESKVNKLLMGGGFLSSERRKILEDAWGAECYNMFGMSEMFGPMAGECKQKNGLHYLDEYLMIEIIDPKTHMPVSDGEIGVAVYTTLWDKGFPLLRYWTDDLMYITHEKCKCGRDLPRLFYLGRLNDSFEIGNSYVFPENVENILFKYGNIGEYIVEKESNRYLVKTESSVSNVNAEMVKELETLFSSEVKVEIVTPGCLNYDGHGKRFFNE